MNGQITVDANVMHGFTHSLIKDVASAERQIVEHITAQHSFAIDDTGKIEHQWLETCGKSVFGEWFYSQLQKGVVKKVASKLDASHKKKLQNECGMPMRGEIIYVAVAAVTDNRLIVTEDIDFWEPSAKLKSNEIKQKIKISGKGSVCKYLAKHLQITVATSSMALAKLQ